MRRTLPPLNALRAFEAAGRHQSFSGAAQELGVNHSAISRHVRGLEHRLKVQLFRDLPRGVELTGDGMVFLSRLTPVFDAIAEASDALTERPSGVITVNSEPVFATKWLIPNLGDFNALHPEVEIRLDASRGLADVTRYATDIAFRFYNSGKPGQSAQHLADDWVYPYASPELIAEPLTSPAQLLKYRLLKDRNSDTWARWFALAGGVSPEDVPKSNWRMRAQLALETALAGQGVILCSGAMVQRDVAAGRLVQLSEVGFQEGGYYLLHGDGALRRKAVRVFHSWVLERSHTLQQNPTS